VCLQAAKAGQDTEAGVSHLRALDQKMISEEVLVFVVLVEALGRQDGRQDGNLTVELDLHQRVQHRRGHEFVSVDAPVDDQASGHDSGIPPGLREELDLQREFQRTGYFEEIDHEWTFSAVRDPLIEGMTSLVDDFSMPAGLNERDAKGIA
jgi:hypothetical protein